MNVGGIMTYPLRAEITEFDEVRMVKVAKDLIEARQLRLDQCAKMEWFSAQDDLPRDRAGFVWIAKHCEEVVATARALPHSTGLDNFSRWTKPPVVLNDKWVEFGRLAINRRGARTSAPERLLAEMTRWLLHNTSYTSVYAVCDAEVASYYEAYGLTAAGVFESEWPDAPPRESCMLTAELDTLAAKWSWFR
jgi:predicted GNAT family N-acyltransferase